jgi:hypothetical protein
MKLQSICKTILKGFGLWASLMLGGCSQLTGFSVATFDPNDFVSESSLAEGKLLYQNNCASCHKSLELTNRRDRTADQIAQAIQQIPEMASLKTFLSRDDLQKIAGALSTQSNLACRNATPGRTVIRRMNFREFSNATRDLLGNHSLAAHDFPDDGFGGMGFDNDDQAIRTLGTAGEKIFTAAEKVVDQVMTNPESFLNSCNTSSSRLSCVSNLIQSTARRAFRRDVALADVQSLIDLSMKTSDIRTGVRNAMVAMLASPRFLFHLIDYSVNRKGTTHTLSAFEFASRLSFMLWSSIPDDRLLNLASSGQIFDPITQKAEITRMLADPKAQRFVQAFPAQWLGYNSVLTTERNLSFFPEFNDQLRQSMVNEANLLFMDVFKRNLSVETLITADYTFVDQTLAQFYGIPYPAGSTGFTGVRLDGTNRRGLLTQAAFMTGSVHGNSTSPVHRGIVMLSKVLCQPVGTPPAGIPPLGATDGSLTLREALSEHVSSPTCFSCHKHMDPIGFAFENYNPIGKWRNADLQGRPYQIHGQMPDGFKFNKPGEVALWMATGDKFKACFSNYLAAYSVGRTLSSGDKCLTPEGATIESTIQNIISSDLFRKSTLKE